jgi:hypothetical protein
MRKRQGAPPTVLRRGGCPQMGEAGTPVYRAPTSRTQLAVLARVMRSHVRTGMPQHRPCKRLVTLLVEAVHLVDRLTGLLDGSLIGSSLIGIHKGHKLRIQRLPMHLPQPGLNPHPAPAGNAEIDLPFSIG